MNQLFDPNQPQNPYGDFASQTQRLEAQRRMAELLRRRANQNQGPGQGQMVSGIYVAPSWTQHLGSLFDQFQAGQAERAANAQAQNLAGQVSAARQKWGAALPQAVAAVPEQAGPVDPNNPTELAAQPAKPVTAGQILKHTLAGLEIPGNERAAALYNQGALADLTREDTQTFRKEEAAANRAATLMQHQSQQAARLEELKMRLEDRNLDRQSREQMAAEQRALQAQIAAGNQELRRLALEAKKEADAEKAAAKREAAAKAATTTEGEKSSAGYLNRMNEAEKTLQSIGAKGDMGLFEKAVGGVPMVGKTVQPYVLDKNQQALLQAQRDWVRAKLRKESGAVIGDEEMAEEIRTYFPQPGESSEIANQKAAARQAAARQLEIGSGRELPNANMGARGAAQKVTTQVEVDKLPSGTRFVGPDGKTYVKD